MSFVSRILVVLCGGGGLIEDPAIVPSCLSFEKEIDVELECGEGVREMMDGS